MDGAQAEAQVVGRTPTGLLIGGRWRTAAGGQTLPVEDPATGTVLTEVADGRAADALDALAAAHEVQPAWAATPPRERAEILRRAFEAIHDGIDGLSLLLTLEMGKPLSESRSEIAYGAEFFRWFSEEAVRIEGSYRRAPTGGGRLLTLRQPIGPSLLITPWNFPMAMAARKIGPAVAAGCTMVLKPSELTPLSSLALGQILIDAGLPPGVLNIVTTSDAAGTIGPVVIDRRLRKLSFTGSTPVGRRLIEQSSRQVLRVSMELGGNAPFLVFADADLEAAVEGALVAKMRNGGQACTAANRFLVAAEVAEDFAHRLADRMAELRTARGTEAGADVGPLVNERQRSRVADLVDDAVGKGARPICGGTQPDGPGYFYPPTVLFPVPDNATLLGAEIFGPVAPVMPFVDEAGALRAADDTEYGLAAYVYTADIGRALRVAESLKTGMVGLNQAIVSNPAAPFGGVKASGYGREGGHEGITEYLDLKYVAVGHGD